MTGTVELACDVRFSAIVNSFQLKMKLSTPVAISPGVTSVVYHRSLERYGPALRLIELVQSAAAQMRL